LIPSAKAIKPTACDDHGEIKERINVPSSQSSSRIVLPTDAVEKSARLRSGSKWRQHDLALLKVKFDPAEESELSILDIEHEWSSSQRQSILSPHVKVLSADVP
jgi:hypothetical protein